MNLLPEIRQELLAAAERQERACRSRRRRRFVGLGALTALVTATGAVAATTDVLETGSGPTRTGAYSVRAVTGPDGAVCLAVQISQDGHADGRDPTCQPRPLDRSLTGGFMSVDDAHRLVYAAVGDDVRAVRIEPGGVLPRLKSISGAPGRYFDALVPAAGAIDITLSDAQGQTLQHLDGRDYGPIGTGRVP